MGNKNQSTATIIVLQDSVWQLGNVLRDCLSVLETISITSPDINLNKEIKRCKFALNRHCPDVLKFKPHPYGFKMDAPPQPTTTVRNK